MIALGDITERFLRLFGITKDRVRAITGRQDCGCAKRQTAMNEWGYRWQGRLLMPVHWLRYRWQILRVGKAAMRLRMARRYLWMACRVLIYGP